MDNQLTQVNYYLDRLHLELTAIIDDDRLNPKHKQHLLAAFHSMSHQAAFDLHHDKEAIKIKMALDFVMGETKKFIEEQQKE